MNTMPKTKRSKRQPKPKQSAKLLTRLNGSLDRVVMLIIAVGIIGGGIAALPNKSRVTDDPEATANAFFSAVTNCDTMTMGKYYTAYAHNSPKAQQFAEHCIKDQYRFQYLSTIKALQQGANPVNTSLIYEVTDNQGRSGQLTIYLVGNAQLKGWTVFNISTATLNNSTL